MTDPTERREAGRRRSRRAVSFELEMLRHDRKRLLAGRQPEHLARYPRQLLEALDRRTADLEASNGQ